MKYTSLLTFFFLWLTFSSANEIEYPYYASPERTDSILTGFENIQLGMDTSEVLNILGKPDEIRDLFEPKVYKPDIIGFTYWYLIQRVQANGSQNEKDEKLVRISFDLKGIVTKLDKW